MTTIKAIETSYAGHRFRSRLEARWAVFFDHLGIKWQYEPQGYVIDGEPYLPDFLIHPDTDFATWVEVKGKFPNDAEIAKAAGLAAGTGITTYLYFGGVELPGPGLSQITTVDEYLEEWGSAPQWHDELGWILNGTEAFRWEAGLRPTAFRFNPRQARVPKSGYWWWADCPVCGQVILKLQGQVGWCPLWGDNPPEGEPRYPRFAHETDRLMNAYNAARSARFEHGESGAA